MKHEARTAREPRHNPTPAEDHLWQSLRNRGLTGEKFRRQHAVGPYVLDFFCAARNIAVELDGAHHYQVADVVEYDAVRTAFLAGIGVSVPRFSNRDALDNTAAVLDRIASALSAAPPRYGTQES